MDTMTLDVQTRDKNVRARDLLAVNVIPIEYYGRGVENRSFQVDYQTFRRLYRQTGSNMVIELNVDGGKEKINVLVHDMDHHPATDSITHIDFINVRMGEIIHTKIPLEFVGVAPAIKELGGTMTHHLNEIEVKCLPKDLIHSIEVSVEPIVDFNSYIRVKDLNIPDSLEVLNDPEDVVATAVAPREEEPEPVEGAEAAEGAAGEIAGDAGKEGEDKKEQSAEDSGEKGDKS